MNDGQKQHLSMTVGTWHALVLQKGVTSLFWHKIRGALKPLGTLFEAHGRYMQMGRGPWCACHSRNNHQVTAELHRSVCMHAWRHPLSLRSRDTIKPVGFFSNLTNVTRKQTWVDVESREKPSASPADQDWFAIRFKSRQIFQFEHHVQSLNDLIWTFFLFFFIVFSIEGLRRFLYTPCVFTRM